MSIDKNAPCEREIKTGSVWRNVHGEVTVRNPESHAGVVTDQYNLWEPAFRATHEWVSDPVEKPVVGTWWRERRGSRSVIRYVHGFTHDGMVDTWGWKASDGYYGIDEFMCIFEPCDPPALHRALKELCHAYENWQKGDHCEKRVAHLAAIARKVAKLYQEGER